MKVFYALNLKIALAQMKHLKTQMREEKKKKKEVKMQISKA